MGRMVEWLVYAVVAIVQIAVVVYMLHRLTHDFSRQPPTVDAVSVHSSPAP